MLDIEPKYVVGAGIFDIARKLTNSTVAKKIINSTATKNLKRAADSAIGQEIKKSVLSGVSEASKTQQKELFNNSVYLQLKNVEELKRKKETVLS